jgi:hypothetical protein
LGDGFAVDVEAVVGDLGDVTALGLVIHALGEVDTLALEADPVVEAGLGVIDHAAHVPFPDEGGIVSGGLEVFGKESEVLGERVVIVDDAMIMGVEAGEDGGAAGRAERSGDESVLEVGAVAGEAIHVGGLDEGMAEKAESVVSVVIGEDDDDVARCGVGEFFQGETGRLVCEGGEGSEGEEDEGKGGTHGDRAWAGGEGIGNGFPFALVPLPGGEGQGQEKSKRVQSSSWILMLRQRTWNGPLPALMPWTWSPKWPLG